MVEHSRDWQRGQGAKCSSWANLSACIVDCLIENFVHFRFQFNVFEFVWLKYTYMYINVCMYCKVVETLKRKYCAFYDQV